LGFIQRSCNVPLPYHCSASEKPAAPERSALPVQEGPKHEQQCWCCYCRCCCRTAWCAAQVLMAAVHAAVKHGCTSMQGLVRTDQSFSSSHRAAQILRMAPLRTSVGHESTSSAFVSGTAIALRCKGTASCPAQFCKDVPCCAFAAAVQALSSAVMLSCALNYKTRSLSARYYHSKAAIAYPVHLEFRKTSSLL
jgi:hypothetical protein